MGEIIPFPAHRRMVERAAPRACPSAEEAWAVAADRAMIRYGKSLWPEGAAPGEVGDAWWQFICDWRASAPLVAPAEAPWAELWGTFAKSWRTS